MKLLFLTLAGTIGAATYADGHQEKLGMMAHAAEDLDLGSPSLLRRTRPKYVNVGAMATTSDSLTHRMIKSEKHLEVKSFLGSNHRGLEGTCSDSDRIGPAVMYGEDEICIDLFGGQNILSGQVCVYQDPYDLYNLEVNVVTFDGWTLESVHAHSGLSDSDIPQTRKGNPKIGHFEHNEDLDNVASHHFDVNLMEKICCRALDDEFALAIAVHAVVTKLEGDTTVTETAWAEGDNLVDEGGSWAMSFEIGFVCSDDVDPTGPPPKGCETAFAYAPADGGGTCFTSITDEEGNFKRWGWSIGPLDVGDYTFDIYAGAGKCDISKANPSGQSVGTLTVDYDGDTASVTYTTVEVEDSIYMLETHLYVGHEILASDTNGDLTIAPGQYPHIEDPLEPLDEVTTHTDTIDGLSGDIYVVAHAVVCGNYLE